MTHPDSAEELSTPEAGASRAGTHWLLGPVRPWSITASYAIFATLWIYFSDTALATLVDNPAVLVRWSVFKGLAFVAVTSLMLYLLMQRAFQAIRADADSRARAEQQLNERDAQLATILRKALDAIITVDSDGRIVHFNPAAAAMFRCAQADAARQPLQRFLPAAFDSEGQESLTLEGVRFDGEHFQLEASISRVDPGGKGLRTLIVRDVTQRLAHEVELERLNRLYAALSGVNQTIVWATSRDALLNSVCRALVQHAGFRLAWVAWFEPESQRLIPVAQWGDESGYLKSLQISAEDRPEGHGPIGTAFRLNKPQVSNDIANDPDMAPWREAALAQRIRASAVIPLHLNGQPCGVLAVDAEQPGYFQDREVTLLVEAARDTSFALDSLVTAEEGRFAQEQAESERQFSATMIESMPGIVYFYDVAGRFLRWNRNFEMVSGYSGREIAEMHPLDLFPEAEKAMVEARISKVFETGSAQVEANMRTKSGRLLPYYLTGRRVMYDERLCLVGIGVDISERQALEERLRQTSRMESIGQLTGGVAHDFNNLLTVMLGNAELLAEDLVDPRHRELAEMIVAAAQSGSELTHRLLAFARKQALLPKVIRVDRLVDGMNGLIRRSLGNKVELRVRHAGDVDPAYIDAAQLESALLNLCINARDAMPNGGTLSIQTCNYEVQAGDEAQHPDLRAGHYVKLTIADTGSGIPSEHLEHIFEPFFTTKEQGKGTGLGMAMVYGFIKQSGGHLSLSSEVGEGTSISLFLPAAPEARVEDGAPLATTIESGSERVLLVEDDELVRRFAFDQLIAFGYQVTEASGPGEALRLLTSDQPFDLLLTDVVMPEMSGRILADKARELRPRLAVLFTSGYTQNALNQKDSDHPEVLLGKPYRRVELARKVREALAAATV